MSNNIQNNKVGLVLLLIVLILMDPFQKTKPSGNYNANSVTAAMFGHGWVISLSEACIMYSGKT